MDLSKLFWLKKKENKEISNEHTKKWKILENRKEIDTILVREISRWVLKGFRILNIVSRRWDSKRSRLNSDNGLHYSCTILKILRQLKIWCISSKISFEISQYPIIS